MRPFLLVLAVLLGVWSGISGCQAKSDTIRGEVIRATEKEIWVDWSQSSKLEKQKIDVGYFYKISIDSHTVIRSFTGKQLKPEEIATGVSVTVKTRKPLSAYKSGAVFLFGEDDEPSARRP
ncbi:hypothetical protein [Anoxybacillus sp. J5B_2022]|uniref:hypothetical protein n=1 Tax=Anoxybacillus sp. J5B_2022 TaxID=3003246 RepID=UPI0022860942|nr:hypothetical protein [Anoxybacillus sp. J5B_2022]MCZ0755339.1 hypothetical protein [Anoxybacillus sp. J5B_2022]